VISPGAIPSVEINDTSSTDELPIDDDARDLAYLGEEYARGFDAQGDFDEWARRTP